MVEVTYEVTHHNEDGEIIDGTPGVTRGQLPALLALFEERVLAKTKFHEVEGCELDGFYDETCQVIIMIDNAHELDL